MKVIILCGGQGTRLKEETEFKPKALVTVGDKPIIVHIMDHYARYGHSEFVLALGYKGDMIKEYFFMSSIMASGCKINKDGSWKGVDAYSGKYEITFVDTGIETLPGERILRCMPHAGYGDFMVTYGDGVADIDIGALVKFHTNHGKIGTMTIVHPHSKFGTVDVDEDKSVRRFIEKPVLDSVVNGGFMVFKRDFFNYLKPREMEHEGLKRLIEKKELMAYKHDGFFFAVDTYKELEELNKIYKEGGMNA